MQTAYLDSPDVSFFSDANIQLDFILHPLCSAERDESDHGEIEQFINHQGVALLRRLLQGFLDQKAAHETTQNLVISNQDGGLNQVRHSTRRKINRLLGEVVVYRKRYGQSEKKNLFPMDAELNLSNDKDSEGLRHRVAKEAIRGAFDDVVESIDTTPGGHVPKRQSLTLRQDVAQDFEGFYPQNRYEAAAKTADLWVLSFRTQ